MLSNAPSMDSQRGEQLQNSGKVPSGLRLQHISEISESIETTTAGTLRTQIQAQQQAQQQENELENVNDKGKEKINPKDLPPPFLQPMDEKENDDGSNDIFVELSTSLGGLNIEKEQTTKRMKKLKLLEEQAIEKFSLENLCNRYEYARYVGKGRYGIIVLLHYCPKLVRNCSKSVVKFWHSVFCFSLFLFV